MILLAETKRRVTPHYSSHEFSQVFGNFFIVDIVAREHVVGNPLAIGRQIANTGLRERHFERDARRFRSKFTKGI